MEIPPDEDEDEYYWVESEGNAILDYVFDNFARVKKRHHRTEGKLAFVTPEEKEKEAERGDDLTYGLILDIHEVLSQIPDVASYKRFVDLGSGIGRMVLQVFLTTEIEDVLGIEVVESRFEKSREHVVRLSEKYPEYRLLVNDDSEIQMIYTGQRDFVARHAMKTLTILKRNMYDHSYDFVNDTTTKSIVNSHVLTKKVPEYKRFMGGFKRSFCVSMYPINETSAVHHVKTDWNTTRGFPFYLTDLNR
jgi:hypothetical protein